jgi:ribosome-associated translation inhibitor RaiA
LANERAARRESGSEDNGVNEEFRLPRKNGGIRPYPEGHRERTLFTKRKENYTMTTPAKTTFRNMAPSEAVADRIQKETDALEKYFERITSCHVMVEAPARHNHHGEPFHIRIELRVPGKELVVAHAPAGRAAVEQEDEGRRRKHHEIEAPHKDVYVAIRDGFRAMRRQLQDYVHCLRGEVKAHEPATA